MKRKKRQKQVGMHIIRLFLVILNILRIYRPITDTNTKLSFSVKAG